MVVLSPTAAPLMRRVGAKRTMLLGALCGLSGFGLAFAHGSIWMVVMWLAVAGALPAWEGSASFAVGAEAVPPEKGVIVSTICNTAGAIGAAVATAIVGYVLTLRQVSLEVAAPGGTVTEIFPAESTFTWSALIVSVVALVNIACVLTIRSGRLAPVGRTEFRPVVLEPEA
jgi:MFS family permease